MIEQKLNKKYSLNNISSLVRAILQTREFEERFLKIGMAQKRLGHGVGIGLLMTLMATK